MQLEQTEEIHQINDAIEEIPVETKHKKNILRISNLNLGRGLYRKEELIKKTIYEQNCDICSLSEVDIKYFDEKKPFSIDGYKTYFPLERLGTSTKRLICLVKVGVEAKQRDDLMSKSLSNVWLEIKGENQKVLICTIYREFNDLTGKGPMTIHQQFEKLHILHSQIEKASKEGLVLVIGDMNIDLEKWEDDPNYYQKKQAEVYQSLIGECCLEVINFGMTWERVQNGNLITSAIDPALTNKPSSIESYQKTEIEYSDHDMISVDPNIQIH
jgi:hypothetical protein